MPFLDDYGGLQLLLIFATPNDPEFKLKMSNYDNISFNYYYTSLHVQLDTLLISH